MVEELTKQTQMSPNPPSEESLLDYMRKLRAGLLEKARMWRAEEASGQLDSRLYHAGRCRKLAQNAEAKAAALQVTIDALAGPPVPEPRPERHWFDVVANLGAYIGIAGGLLCVGITKLYYYLKGVG